MTVAACWGVYREREHSPGRESDDALILEAAARRLEARGVRVRLLDPAALPDAASEAPPRLVFAMCEQEPALRALERLEAAGALLVNPVAGVRNTFRHRMLPRLEPLGPGFPASRLVATSDDVPPGLGDVWVKRGDYHQTQAGDVARGRTPDETRAALDALRRRGIGLAVLQEHVEGDLIKLYGVGTGPDGWFHHFPHRDQVLHRHPFDPQALARLARDAARRLDLEVFGGDAIVTAEGRICMIDVNTWPSFALVREEAAEHIAAHLAGRLAAALAAGPRQEDLP